VGGSEVGDVCEVLVGGGGAEVEGEGDGGTAAHATPSSATNNSSDAYGRTPTIAL
jgi:hypothetical protein